MAPLSTVTPVHPARNATVDKPLFPALWSSEVIFWVFNGSAATWWPQRKQLPLSVSQAVAECPPLRVTYTRLPGSTPHQQVRCDIWSAAKCRGQMAEHDSVRPTTVLPLFPFSKPSEARCAGRSATTHRLLTTSVGGGEERFVVRFWVKIGGETGCLATAEVSWKCRRRYASVVERGNVAVRNAHRTWMKTMTTCISYYSMKKTPTGAWATEVHVYLGVQLHTMYNCIPRIQLYV